MVGEHDRQVLAQLLSAADVGLDGSRPWDIRVLDPRTYQRILASGSLGAGEAYMDGWWECPQLDEMLRRVLAAHLDDKLPTARQIYAFLRARLFNPQTP